MEALSRSRSLSSFSYVDRLCHQKLQISFNVFIENKSVTINIENNLNIVKMQMSKKNDLDIFFKTKFY